ncbi:uncharacterized protein BO72DRAFT_285584 [Aspergillus fijiensis CBS 313.89]|uniref:Secreted protein n=1 Tax=Aspergillus fijiensis CBS 313.89 TaxID=1448319 RepID=A0A8G1RZL4_9EURO|nr:uncharacterized protein BO72DRAFT_285584 [Aspergillus fijiensis CBS 313.89]RAK80665.1 hypothetical protein BO72DRAFT_285584 [Aspergillus fijiensis CBS 313.89]
MLIVFLLCLLPALSSGSARCASRPLGFVSSGIRLLLVPSRWRVSLSLFSPLPVGMSCLVWQSPSRIRPLFWIGARGMGIMTRLCVSSLDVDRP